MSFLPDNPHAVLISLEDGIIEHFHTHNEAAAYRFIFNEYGPLHPDRFMVIPIMETYISKGTAQRGFEEFSVG